MVYKVKHKIKDNQTIKKFFNPRIIAYSIALVTVVLIFFILIQKNTTKSFDALQEVTNMLGKVDKIDSKILNNALFYENTTTNIFSIEIKFKGGSAFDEIGKEGSAYLLANTMIEAGGGLSSYEFQKILDDYSIKLSATSKRDTLVFQITSLVYYKQQAFDILDKVLNQPNLSLEEINGVKNNVITEIKFSNSSPDYLLSSTLNKEIFPKSTYYRDIIGTEDTIKGITEGDLRKLKSKLISRSNVYIAISGNVEKNDITKRLETVFKKIPEDNNLEIQQLSPTIVNKSINVSLPNPSQAEVIMALKKPIKDSGEEFYFNVINAYIGLIPDSVLFNKLRNDTGYVYSIFSSNYKDTFSEFWELSFGTSLSSLEIAKAKVVEVLQSIKQGDYKLADVYTALDWLLVRELEKYSNNQGIASSINNIQFKGYTISSYLENLTKMQKMQKSDIDKIMNQIDLQNIATVQITAK